MGGEYLKKVKEVHTRENGQTIYNMGKELKLGVTVINMKVNITKGRSKV